MSSRDAEGDLAAATQMVAKIRDLSAGSSGIESHAAGVLSTDATEWARSQPHGQVVPTGAQVSRLEYGPGGARVRGAAATTAVVFMVPVTSVNLAVTDTVRRERGGQIQQEGGQAAKKRAVPGVLVCSSTL